MPHCSRNQWPNSHNNSLITNLSNKCNSKSSNSNCLLQPSQLNCPEARRQPRQILSSKYLTRLKIYQLLNPFKK